MHLLCPDGAEDLCALLPWASPTVIQMTPFQGLPGLFASFSTNYNPL